jgi:hypothetical protein
MYKVDLIIYWNLFIIIFNYITMMINALRSSRKEWNVQASLIAERTHNPIRSIIEHIVMEPNPKKPLIALSIGKFRNYM